MDMRFWLARAEEQLRELGRARWAVATTEVTFNPFLPEFHANPYPFSHR
jgi:hypothetical protein